MMLPAALGRRTAFTMDISNVMQTYEQDLFNFKLTIIISDHTRSNKVSAGTLNLLVEKLLILIFVH